MSVALYLFLRSLFFFRGVCCPFSAAYTSPPPPPIAFPPVVQRSQQLWRMHRGGDRPGQHPRRRNQRRPHPARNLPWLSLRWCPYHSKQSDCLHHLLPESTICGRVRGICLFLLRGCVMCWVVGSVHTSTHLPLPFILVPLLPWLWCRPDVVWTCEGSPGRRHMIISGASSASRWFPLLLLLRGPGGGYW